MQKLINFLPNTNLIDENRENVRFHDLVRGKTVILNMFYSNCKIKCVPLGKLMRRVNLILNKYILKENIHFISITLDAKNDTVDDLNRFKEGVTCEECLNWHFYTGDFDEIEVLRHKLGMYNPEPEIDAIKSNHTGSFMIFNEQTGFVKHTQAFDNPVDVARKVIQMLPRNFYSHSYNLDDLNFGALTDEEIFDNIQTMNSVFTVPFLPTHIRNKFDTYAEKQRGFQYEPPIKKNSGGSCCCKKK
jgi:protein SCO1/2